jgi:hypothetical protein
MDRLRRTREPARLIAVAWPSPAPEWPMASRPTSPTSAHGYHQESMTAVPSKEPRQAPQDGA